MKEDMKEDKRAEGLGRVIIRGEVGIEDKNKNKKRNSLYS